jgi:hypothetical protein
MSERKKIGTMYEALFKAEALKHGLDISPSEGDYMPYDCIIDNGKKLLRVQIKGTSFRQRGKTNAYMVTTAMGAKTSQKTHYAENAYDILACCVNTGDATYWYIIPKNKIGKRLSINLFPNPSSKGQWEKYRHGWNLIC